MKHEVPEGVVRNWIVVRPGHPLCQAEGGTLYIVSTLKWGRNVIKCVLERACQRQNDRFNVARMEAGNQLEGFCRKQTSNRTVATREGAGGRGTDRLESISKA